MQENFRIASHTEKLSPRILIYDLNFLMALIE